MNTRQITDKHLQSDLFNKGLTGSPLERIIEGCLRASNGSCLDVELELQAVKKLLNDCLLAEMESLLNVELQKILKQKRIKTTS